MVDHGGLAAGWRHGRLHGLAGEAQGARRDDLLAHARAADPQAAALRRQAARPPGQREAEILSAVADGAATIPEIVALRYRGLDPRLRPAAARTVLAHLIHLVEGGRVACPGEPDEGARYSAT